uniref:NADH-ubiquinone oxidoreductase chain 4L n=1 Tax=Hippopus hippopus TaxID=80818 RepID=A0A3S5H353_9BIVA|nr:NADH dehydrogenase subunit 4L [Hippopus hippopus]QNK04080.1 NADH dehydrogenase subunit 4L [Hippopus hippopus]
MSMVFWLVIFTGCSVIMSEPNHVMSVLLGMEILSIGVYSVMVSVLSFNGTLMFCLLFLTLSVCEAVLGLSVLVSLAKSYGKEKSPTFFLLKF